MIARGTVNRRQEGRKERRGSNAMSPNVVDPPKASPGPPRRKRGGRQKGKKDLRKHAHTMASAIETKQERERNSPTQLSTWDMHPSDTSSDTSEAALAMEQIFGVSNMSYGEYVNSLKRGGDVAEDEMKKGDSFLLLNEDEYGDISPFGEDHSVDVSNVPFGGSGYPMPTSIIDDGDYDSDALEDICRIEIMLENRDKTIFREKDTLFHSKQVSQLPERDQLEMSEILQEITHRSTTSSFSVEENGGEGEGEFSPRVHKRDLPASYQESIRNVFLSSAPPSALPPGASKSLPTKQKKQQARSQSEGEDERKTKSLSRKGKVAVQNKPKPQPPASSQPGRSEKKHKEAPLPGKKGSTAAKRGTRRRVSLKSAPCPSKPSIVAIEGVLSGEEKVEFPLPAQGN